MLSELKLKEIQLQEREWALKAREERLERESQQGEAKESYRGYLMCENLFEWSILYMCIL